MLPVHLGTLGRMNSTPVHLQLHSLGLPKWHVPASARSLSLADFDLWDKLVKEIFARLAENLHLLVGRLKKE